MKIYQYPSQAAEKRLLQIEQRGLGIRRKDLTAVQRILEQVRKHGDEALVKYNRQFDAPRFRENQIVVTPQEMAAAKGKVGAGFKRSLNRAARQIASFHTQQRTRSWIDTPRPGTLMGQMVHPVDAAGLYVPGGQGGETPLVSSVLMGAIPAKIAGVPQIVMVTPPTQDGSVSPYLLAAAQKAGVDAVYKVGSAWAIAALAYGTATIPKVDVIVGPGNIYVTLAKKLVAGTVQIDMIAGPSEILVLADQSADPEYVAADMLSQAEHDPLASAMLVTDSKPLAEAVDKALARQLEPLGRRSIAEQSLKSFGLLMVVTDISAAIDLANRIAPEHLELMISDPFARVGELRHAGAIFVGPYTPEPVGDYMAGPNHVLPTGGTARFSSALSVDHFVKKTSLIHYAQDAFQKEAQDIKRLANIEGLGAHAQAVKVRMGSKKK
ncbi:MAG: histidinol dehydrogenase [Desulfobacteraceae bacterium]|jgi:histidinol dehydrogenase